MGSPYAYRYSRSPATPARQREPGSSPPSTDQCSDGRRQRRLVDRARDPHPRPTRELDLDGPTTSRPCWRRLRLRRLRLQGHHRRDEADLLLRSALLLDPERPAPLKQLRPREAVAPRRRRDLARRLQALQHDLELLVLGPASPPTRLHNFQPLNQIGRAHV